ncbi:MAG: exodeoxyribonuclease V subunit gamma, partial [Lentisphaeraceae bacterium]|nr:exodeoxyribonuclease V subunit gamma [Lentisphaeraceae bacterium]
MPDNKIELYFSNSVEKLSQILAANLAVEQQHSDIFNPLSVIVPNGNMQKYLQITLAEQNGICSNVDFPFLEQGLWQAVKFLSTSNNNSLNLNPAKLSQLIMLTLNQENLQREEYLPFLHYLSEDDSTQKLWQLSTRLAARYHEYQ